MFGIYYHSTRTGFGHLLMNYFNKLHFVLSIDVFYGRRKGLFIRIHGIFTTGRNTSGCMFVKVYKPLPIIRITAINTVNTSIFTSTDWHKYIQYCQKHIHLMPNLHIGFSILPKIQPFYIFMKIRGSGRLKI